LVNAKHCSESPIFHKSVAVHGHLCAPHYQIMEDAQAMEVVRPRDMDMVILQPTRFINAVLDLEDLNIGLHRTTVRATYR